LGWWIKTVLGIEALWHETPCKDAVK